MRHASLFSSYIIYFFIVFSVYIFLASERDLCAGVSHLVRDGRQWMGQGVQAPAYRNLLSLITGLPIFNYRCRGRVGPGPG